MNKTVNADQNPTEVFDRMMENPEWMGYGYLGERRNESEESRRRGDQIAFQNAVDHGLTEDQLFEWANSRNGRKFGDNVFGGWDKIWPSGLPSNYPFWHSVRNR